MGHRSAPVGHRVLVRAPFGRDAQSIVEMLTRSGYDTKLCDSLTEVAVALDDHVGVVLITEEAMRDNTAVLQEALAQQPEWSDLPFVLLAPPRSKTASSEAARIRLPDFLDHAVVLERPLGSTSLQSAVASAMRTRQKQFEMRDRLNELLRTRHELAHSEAQLRLATDAAEIGFWDRDPIRNTMIWPGRVKAMFGLPLDADVSLEDFHAGIHPEDLDRVSAAYAAAQDPIKRALYDVEYRTIGRLDGVVRWIAAKGRGVFDESGICTRVVGTAIDVTARKTAELALLSLNEKLEEHVKERTDRLMRTEAVLRQSMKMEAVGQLTGGIAHDFNNMLTGVIGALDLLGRRLASGRTDGLERFIETANASAQKAANLTHRLLAFARRQSLEAKPFDVNQLIGSLEELLRRTIREDISLKVVAAADIPFALADVNQLENAIINLSINARDAMPNGGLLTIETRVIDLDAGYAAINPTIKPGKYIVVTVSDTGVGMAPDVLDKVFDPFFTTKPIGQGTGLGLSMVYGFARQSNGQVRIHSKPSVGTSVSIYLPAFLGTVVEVEGEQRSNPVPEGSGQTVLIVEDEPAVRMLVLEVLKELHYVAIECEEADGAIKVLSSGREIDLMVSDVGLPGMNGRQLADIARLHRPNLPILFVTGYAENAAIRAGFLGANMAMITKPFALDMLAKKIAELLP